MKRNDQFIQKTNINPLKNTDTITMYMPTNIYNMNTQSRIFFHTSLKENRYYSIQERRYSSMQSKKELKNHYQKIITILKECKIDLPKTALESM